MIFRQFVACSLIIFSVGCAKPNYQDRTPTAVPQGENPDPQTPPQQKQCEHFFSKLRLCLTYKWIKPATTTEMGELEFYFSTAEQPEEILEISKQPSVVLWMPSMGHGSRPTKTEKQADHRYRTSNVFFIMPGVWEIKFQIKENKEVVDEYTLKTTI